jgi:hypothetical protein
LAAKRVAFEVIQIASRGKVLGIVKCAGIASSIHLAWQRALFCQPSLRLLLVPKAPAAKQR